MRKNLRRILPVLLLLVLSIALAGCTASGKQSDASAAPTAGAQGEHTIELTVTYGENSKAYTITTAAQTLLEALDGVVEYQGENSAYGYTLTAVNGVEADFTKGGNAYWAIYVNGAYGTLSLDKQPIADGDHFLLKYETY